MASRKRKPVKIQYRKLDTISALGRKTLQQALLAAIPLDGDLDTDPSKRIYFKDEGYGTLVLNYMDRKNDFFFGELVRFEPGAALPLLAIASNTKSYNLTQAKAPQGHEPLRGVLYFMAIKNHFMVLENDVSTGRAEIYFEWLLTQASQVAPKGTHIILLAELDAQAGARQLSQVDEVVFRPQAAVSRELLAAPGDATPTATVGSTSRDVSGTNTLDVLRAAGMDNADIQSLMQADTEIEIVLQIKFKGQRRRKPLGIDDANRLLRNIPEDEVTLTGPGGRQKHGKIVKLAYPANIALVGSLLETTDVARALLEAYHYFVTNGYIDG